VESPQTESIAMQKNRQQGSTFCFDRMCCLGRSAVESGARMSNPETKLNGLLREHRFELVRSTKHRVFRNPTGQIFVMSATPSDHRSAGNALTQLKRVIANPPQPFVVAIADYERDEAARVIAAQPKQLKPGHGMGSGKQRRSHDIGIYYEPEKILTAEELQHQEQLRQQAIAARQRREEKTRQRREDKLARRAAIEEQRRQEEQQFERSFRTFLNLMKTYIDKNETKFTKMCDSVIENRAWAATDFYEFPTDPVVRAAEDWAHEVIKNGFEGFEGGPRDQRERDYVVDRSKLAFAGYKAKTDQRGPRLIKIIERQLGQSDSVWRLVSTLEKTCAEFYAKGNDVSTAWDYGRCLVMLVEDINDLISGVFDHGNDTLIDVTANGSLLIALHQSDDKHKVWKEHRTLTGVATRPYLDSLGWLPPEFEPNLEKLAA
jgi:hypothetical protein